MVRLGAIKLGVITLLTCTFPLVGVVETHASPVLPRGDNSGPATHPAKPHGPVQPRNPRAPQNFDNIIVKSEPANSNPIMILASTPTPKTPQITGIKWFSDKRVGMWIYSPAMKTTIQVQLLLPRDWNSAPGETFPTLYMLDGFFARDDQNGWILNTNAEKFFANKNALIVLPVGGQSSFYSDWKQPDNGKNYQWETFLTKELPPILESSWRANSMRGIEGPSMGGTAAMTLAARHPGFYAYAGSFSGILDLDATGVPLAIQVAQREAGNFDSIKMYGLPSDPAWVQHDPLSLAPKLQGTALYVSSGNGTRGAYDLNRNPVVDTAVLGLEMLSRVSSEQFANRLNQLSIPAIVVYRPSGTHTWPYWQFEMQQSWPTAAQALRVSPGAACSVGGDIAKMAALHPQIGNCITPEYISGPARIQDFMNGRIVWSQQTGAHIVNGAIGGAYIGNGSVLGDLGLPIDEKRYYGNQVWMQHFKNGLIVWSEKSGAHPLYGAIATKWLASGGIKDPLGLPAGEEVSTANNVGRVQGFEHGAMYYSPGVGTYQVMGDIYKKYASQNWEQGILGFPVSDAKPLINGATYQKFAGGNIYQTRRGAFQVPNGAIMDAWASKKYERGPLGYPTADMQIIPGGSAQTFEHGAITIVNGTVNYS